MDDPTLSGSVFDGPRLAKDRDGLSVPPWWLPCCPSQADQPSQYVRVGVMVGRRVGRPVDAVGAGVGLCRGMRGRGGGGRASQPVGPSNTIAARAGCCSLSSWLWWSWWCCPQRYGTSATTPTWLSVRARAGARAGAAPRRTWWSVRRHRAPARSHGSRSTCHPRDQSGLRGSTDKDVSMRTSRGDCCCC